jgi:hypothetical protein
MHIRKLRRCQASVDDSPDVKPRYDSGIGFCIPSYVHNCGRSMSIKVSLLCLRRWAEHRPTRHPTGEESNIKLGLQFNLNTHHIVLLATLHF